jgi:hypothetical protein
MKLSNDIELFICPLVVCSFMYVLKDTIASSFPNVENVVRNRIGKKVHVVAECFANSR